MLKVENLSTSYKLIDGDVHVLNDLNFEIHDNEIFGIAGESGCGKTTLLKTLYDIIEFPLEIDKGKVILSGEKNGQSFSYESGNIQKTWWNNISYVPQAAQSVLNPIVRLKKQFLDSIPQEDRKNETKEQTLARVAKYLEERYAPACYHRTCDLYVPECRACRRTDHRSGRCCAEGHFEDADALAEATQEHHGHRQP